MVSVGTIGEMVSARFAPLAFQPDGSGRVRRRKTGRKAPDANCRKKQSRRDQHDDPRGKPFETVRDIIRNPVCGIGTTCGLTLAFVSRCVECGVTRGKPWMDYGKGAEGAISKFQHGPCLEKRKQVFWLAEVKSYDVPPITSPPECQA